MHEPLSLGDAFGEVRDPRSREPEHKLTKMIDKRSPYGQFKILIDSEIDLAFKVG